MPRQLLEVYARAQRLAAFGVAALTRKIDDAAEVARVTQTSIGAAKDAVDTGRTLASNSELDQAFRSGALSLDQASEIAKAERSAPGSASALVDVAASRPFHVLREKARKVALEAEQHRDLGTRQHEARKARTYSDELGMTHIHLELQPHVGTPVVARAEAEAQRLARVAKQEGNQPEAFERYLADAYARMLTGGGSGRGKRPELVVLVSHEVAKRGWCDVREGEVCKIPGVGPVAPQVAKDIAQDAFLNGVFFDGTDLRHFKRWSRHRPPEVAVALELGVAPEFDGVACVDCGNRFRTEFDHVHPHTAGGPTSHPNLDPRCWSCHQAKSAADRRNGKQRPPES